MRFSTSHFQISHLCDIKLHIVNQFVIMNVRVHLFLCRTSLYKNIQLSALLHILGHLELMDNQKTRLN